jgi:hypothetical protein
MASLKKSKKAAGKPGAGLAIALVLFILIAIGAGVWGYYGYKGQEELRVKAKTADAEATAAKAGRKYFRFLAMDYAMALGHKLDPESAKDYEDLRTQFFAYFDSPDSAPDFKALGAPAGGESPALVDKKNVEDNKKDLDFDGKVYKTNVLELHKSDLKRLAEAEAAADARYETAVKEKARFEGLKDKLDTFWDATIKKIGEGNAEAVAEAKKIHKEMETALNTGKELNDRLLEVTDAKAKIGRAHV